MSVAFNLKVVPFSGHGIQSSRETFPAKEIPMTTSTKSTMTVKCNLNISTVEYFLKNYHGILDRVAVRRSLDLYNISHYQIPDRFPNEDFLEFSRNDFNICQARKNFSNCRAIFGEPEFSDARIAFAKQIILVTHIDDFFDHSGSREESYMILDLVQE
ncbi:hypothetical protein ACS0TY_012221 [Phlomoides rotata]